MSKVNYRFRPHKLVIKVVYGDIDTYLDDISLEGYCYYQKLYINLEAFGELARDCDDSFLLDEMVRVISHEQLHLDIRGKMKDETATYALDCLGIEWIR